MVSTHALSLSHSLSRAVCLSLSVSQPNELKQEWHLCRRLYTVLFSSLMVQITKAVGWKLTFEMQLWFGLVWLTDWLLSSGMNNEPPTHILVLWIFLYCMIWFDVHMSLEVKSHVTAKHWINQHFPHLPPSVTYYSTLPECKWYLDWVILTYRTTSLPNYRSKPLLVAQTVTDQRSSVSSTSSNVKPPWDQCYSLHMKSLFPRRYIHQIFTFVFSHL